jgi:hypothetical protein
MGLVERVEFFLCDLRKVKRVYQSVMCVIYDVPPHHHVHIEIRQNANRFYLVLRLVTHGFDDQPGPQYEIRRARESWSYPRSTFVAKTSSLG